MKKFKKAVKKIFSDYHVYNDLYKQKLNDYEEEEKRKTIKFIVAVFSSFILYLFLSVIILLYSHFQKNIFLFLIIVCFMYINFVYVSFFMRL